MSASGAGVLGAALIGGGCAQVVVRYTIDWRRDRLHVDMSSRSHSGVATMTNLALFDAPRRVKIAFALVVGLAALPKTQSIAFTPISDLGTGLYLNQFQGGLYPSGSNMRAGRACGRRAVASHGDPAA